MMEEEKKNWNWREENVFSYQLQAASCQESSKITGEREREREREKGERRWRERGGGWGAGWRGRTLLVHHVCTQPCRADSSKLLFQAGYIQVLKQMALSGQLQQYNIRSVCWKVTQHSHTHTHLLAGIFQGRTLLWIGMEGAFCRENFHGMLN